MNCSQFYCRENWKQDWWPDVDEHRAVRLRTASPAGWDWAGAVVTDGARSAVFVVLPHIDVVPSVKPTGRLLQVTTTSPP